MCTVNGRGVQEWHSASRRVRLSEIRIINLLLFCKSYLHSMCTLSPSNTGAEEYVASRPGSCRTKISRPVTFLNFYENLTNRLSGNLVQYLLRVFVAVI